MLKGPRGSRWRSGGPRGNVGLLGDPMGSMGLMGLPIYMGSRFFLWADGQVQGIT